MEKVTTFFCYLFSACMAWLSGLSPQDIAFLLGAVVGVGTFIVNWYYRRKTYRLLQSMGIDRGINDAINR